MWALLLFSAFAFEGKLNGPGSAYMHTSQKQRQCSEIFLNLSKSPTHFSILDGGYICEDMQASFPASRFEIRGSELFYHNQLAGSISDEKITLFVDNKEENFTYSLNLEKNGSSVSFIETWTENQKPALTIHGLLRSK